LVLDPKNRFASTGGHAIALALIVAASFALRVYVSRHCSFWLDEVWTRHDAALSWPELLHGPSREHPPLMFWFVRASMTLFGTGETAIRLPSLLFGSVLLVGVYLLCLELELHATQALVVVASVALSPFFARHATEARQYSMLPAFTTFATLFALRLLRRPGSSRALVGFSLSAAAAAATQYFGLAYAAALVAALAAGAVWAWRRGDALPALSARSLVVVGGLCIGLGIVALRAIWLARFYTEHQSGPSTRDLFTSILRDFSFFHECPLAEKIEPFIAAAGLVALALRLRGVARFVPFALAFPPCAGALLISSGHAVAPRYLAPSFIFYQLGATGALLMLADRLLGKDATINIWNVLRSGAAALLLIVPFGLRLAQYPAGYGAGRDYYAGLQAYFDADRAKHTALIVFPHFPGAFIMRTQYDIDAPIVSLESFQPIDGVTRYVIAEFERSSQARQFELELGKQLHVSQRRWRALPLAPLAHSKFQPAVRARILELAP
jgi:hypothetical protein